jgi:hypothetical protein
MDERLAPLAAPRPFLVVGRVGDASQHGSWITGDPQRNWDFLANTYSKRPDFDPGPCEYASRRGITKFPGAAEIFAAAPFLATQYDAVMFIDDDVAAPPGRLSRLFERFIALGLKLGQAALTPNSPHSHVETLANPTTAVRYTDFVEVMMPIFRRDALATCLPTFPTCISGWGLDWVWPHLVGYHHKEVGFIDDLPLTHTKPVDLEGGAFYALLRSLGVDPWQEMDALLARHGLKRAPPRILGAQLRRIDPAALARLSVRYS